MNRFVFNDGTLERPQPTSHAHFGAPSVAGHTPAAVAAPYAVRGVGRANEPMSRAERDLFARKCRAAPYPCGEERQAAVRPSRLQQPPENFRAFADADAVSANAPDMFHIDEVSRHMSLAECEWRENEPARRAKLARAQRRRDGGRARDLGQGGLGAEHSAQSNAECAVGRAPGASHVAFDGTSSAAPGWFHPPGVPALDRWQSRPQAKHCFSLQPQRQAQQQGQPTPPPQPLLADAGRRALHKSFVSSDGPSFIVDTAQRSKAPLNHVPHRAEGVRINGSSAAARARQTAMNTGIGSVAAAPACAGQNESFYPPCSPGAAAAARRDAWREHARARNHGCLLGASDDGLGFKFRDDGLVRGRARAASRPVSQIGAAGGMGPLFESPPRFRTEEEAMAWLARVAAAAAAAAAAGGAAAAVTAAAAAAATMDRINSHRMHAVPLGPRPPRVRPSRAKGFFSDLAGETGEITAQREHAGDHNPRAFDRLMMADKAPPRRLW